MPIDVSAKRGFERLTEALEKMLDSIGEGEELMLISARQIEAKRSKGPKQLL